MKTQYSALHLLPQDFSRKKAGKLPVRDTLLNWLWNGPVSCTSHCHSEGKYLIANAVGRLVTKSDHRAHTSHFFSPNTIWVHVPCRFLSEVAIMTSQNYQEVGRRTGCSTVPGGWVHDFQGQMPFTQPRLEQCKVELSWWAALTMLCGIYNTEKSGYIHFHIFVINKQDIPCPHLGFAYTVLLHSFLGQGGKLVKATFWIGESPKPISQLKAPSDTGPATFVANPRTLQGLVHCLRPLTRRSHTTQMLIDQCL